MTDTARTIRIVIDPSGANSGAAQANRALASIGNAGASAGNQLGNFNRNLGATGNSAQRMGAALSAANDNALNLNGGLLRMIGSLGRASIAVVGLTALTGGIAGLAAAFTGAGDKAAMMAARLNVAYSSAKDLAAANQAVHNIANQTRSDLGAVAYLYTKMAASADLLKLSQAQVGVATRTFALSLKVSGASATEAASAIMQLGQAMGKNMLNGDEFNAVSENNALFMKMLAVSMDMPIGKLKGLGAQGKITGADIAKALTDPAMIAAIEAQFGRIPVTFGDVRVGIENAMVDIAAALKRGLGIDDSLAVMLSKVQNFAQQSQPFFEKLGTAIRSVVTGIAPIFRTAFAVLSPIVMALVTNMDSLVRVAKSAALAFTVLRAAMAVNSFTTMLAPVIALEKAMGATGTASALFSVGLKAAQGAVNGFTAALLANPFTALAVGITAVVALLYEFSDQIGIGGGNMATLADIAAVVWGDITSGLGTLVGYAESAFSAIGSLFATLFSPIADIAKAVFGDLDFSLSGFLIGTARVVDGVVGFFRGGFLAVQQIWSNISAMLWPYVSWIVTAMQTAYGAITSLWGRFSSWISGVFSSAFNFAASIVQNFVNKAIGAINTVLALGNKLGLGITLLSPISILGAGGAAAFQKAGEGAGAAFNSGFGHEAEDYVKGVIGRGNTRAGSRGAVTPHSMAAAAGITPKVGPTANSGDDKADKAKKALENILKKTKEFWAELKEAVNVAGMLPLDAERYNRELELRKILGGGVLKDSIQLTEVQREQIANLMRQKTIAAAITDIREEARKANNQLLVNQMRHTGLSERELEIENQLSDRRKKALDDGATMADLTGALWRLEESKLAIILRQNAAYDEQAAKLKDMQKTGLDLIDRYGREADPASAARSDYAKRVAAIQSAVKPEGTSQSDWEKKVRTAMKGAATELEHDLKEANQQFYSSFTDSIGRLAQTFGGKFGSILGNIADIFTKLSGSISATGPLGKILGKDSALVKGLNQFADGAQTGAQVAEIAKAIGIKGFSKTGSEIGGGIGSIAGKLTGIPGLDIVGSIVGGAIGSLFNKPKHSEANFATDSSGNVIANITGSKGLIKGTTGLAGEVLDGLGKIASQLGGKLTGAPNLTIGTFDGKYRVNDQATTKELHYKNFTSATLHDFGTDGEAEAVAYAIGKALKDGVITGLSDLAQKALKSLDSDAAISFIQQWTSVMSDFQAMTDPVGAAVKGIIDPLATLRDTMVSVGASTEDLNKLEQYRTKKLDEALKDQLSSLTSFQKALSGDGSGVTDLSRLTKDMSDFQSFRDQIASGKQVDQQAFTALGQEIFQLAGSVYGTSTSTFQDIRSMLMDATQGAISNVTSAFNDAQVVAINQTNQLISTQVQQQAIANDYLRQIAEAAQNAASGNGGVGGGGMAVNGVYSSMNYY